MTGKDAAIVPETPADAAARLAALRTRARLLAKLLPNAIAPPPAPRSQAERLRQVIDAQCHLLGDGRIDALAEPLTDAVFMTGEEDPLVEVEDPEFASVVAEFIRSERNARTTHGAAARTRLAQALLPFADASTHVATAMLDAIEQPFFDFATALDVEPRPTDATLISTLIEIVGRAS